MFFFNYSFYKPSDNSNKNEGKANRISLFGKNKIKDPVKFLQNRFMLSKRKSSGMKE